MRVLLLCAAIFIASAEIPAQEVGPAKGSLVIVGGGLRDLSILKRFLDLAGGSHQPIVVIPTAGGADTYDDAWDGLRQFREAGATNLKVLHTRDRKVAETDAFVAPIREAHGVWFGGGRQWRIADSYLNTRTHRELRALLDRGGVIGGSSAGATIQGSFLARGDTKGAETMIGDHQEGFAFLKNVAIDQHLLRRNRQFDLIPLVESRPALLGIGIDEDTAIVVRGDRFEVIGTSYVVIYDAQRRLDSGGQFYFLAPGDEYDLKAREAKRPTRRTEPLPRIVKEPWKKPKSKPNPSTTSARPPVRP